MRHSYGMQGSSAVVGGTALSLTLRAARAYMPGRAKVRLLDVGCGAGAFLKSLPPHFETTGVDYNGQASVKVNISYESLPFPDASFDMVTAWQVFEHLENPFFAGREIARVLRFGGICLISVPNIHHIYARFIFFLHGAIPRWNNRNDHIFVPLKSVFKKAVFPGCALRERRYADGPFSTGWLAKNEYYVFQKN